MKSVERFRSLPAAMAAICAISFIAAWAYVWTLDARFPGYPRQPEPQSGRTIARPWKSTVIYVSPEEREKLGWAHAVEFLSVAGIIGAVIVRRTQRPR